MNKQFNGTKNLKHIPYFNKMFHYCKICGLCLLLSKKIWDSNAGDAYWYKCHLCVEYNIVLSNNKMLIESEGIRVANFKLVYYPNKKMAALWKDNGHDFSASEKIMSFSLNELTHELAIQWVNKLKTLVIFQ